MKLLAAASFVLAVVAGAVLGSTPRPAFAKTECSNWLRQDNGCDWRECVPDDGRTYCEQSCDGEKTIQRVKCSD